MNWDEHEKEYCPIVSEMPTDIYDTALTWADACKFKDHFESGYEEGNVAPLKCVKFQDKYYTVLNND